MIFLLNYKCITPACSLWYEVLYYTEKDEYILLRNLALRNIVMLDESGILIYYKANSSFRFNYRQYYIDGVFQKTLHI